MAKITKVNIQGALRKIRKVERDTALAGETTLNDLKNIGKNYLRTLIPQKSSMATGYTASTIRGRVEKKAKGSTLKIFFDKRGVTPKSQRGWGNKSAKADKWKFKYNFSLVRWMAQSTRASSHFGKSANELKVMDRTRDYLRGIASKRFQTSYRTLRGK